MEWGREGLQKGLQEAWQERPAEIQEGIHGDDALLAGCDTASGAVGAVSGVHVDREAVGGSGISGQLGSLATAPTPLLMFWVVSRSH